MTDFIKLGINLYRRSDKIMIRSRLLRVTLMGSALLSTPVLET